MKNVLLLFVFIIGHSVFSVAQDNSNSHRNEIGVDISALLNKLTGGNFNSGNRLVQYRRYKNNQALRLSLALSYGFSQIDRLQQSFMISPKIGWQRQIELHKKWEAFFGVDGLFNYRNTVSTTTTEQRTTFTYSAGTAAIGGVRFNLTDRISLFTETSYHLLYLSNSQQIIRGGNLEEERSSISFSMGYNPPLNLSLAVRF